MNSQELLHETERSEGEQGWLATFADLMSLLMCFFVLLLSFSEIDVIKFKQLAGSMKHAFGVQQRIPAEDIPKGTSVIAQEFSPGKPEPSPVNQVRQYTTNDSQPLVQRLDGQAKVAQAALSQSLEQAQIRIQTDMAEHLKEGRFELDNLGQQLVIRIHEKGAFASGSAFLQPQFVPLVQQIAGILGDVPGEIIVSGHTDNLPQRNELFQDNLELSAARAIAIARVLSNEANRWRLKVEGLADTQPLLPNTSSANRASNRRVEITLSQGKAINRELSLIELQQGNHNG